MNRRIQLQPSELNPHAKAILQGAATVILAFFAVLILAWAGGV